MDPFIQRMMARSRARREKCFKEMPNDELKSMDQRNPLQEYNQIQRIKGTTEVEVGVAKPGTGSIASSVVVTPTRVESVNAHSDEDEDDAPKENINIEISETKPESTSAIRDSARSRLHRLGALYADSELSSPIHKTEESFSAEQDEREVPDQKQKKSGVRLARFAMLADTIKQWEDDLRHPTAAISPDNQISYEGKTVNDVDHGTNTEDTQNFKILSKPNPDQQCLKNTWEGTKTKEFVLDEGVIATLETLGFSRTQSKSRLVYDYSKHSSPGNGNDVKMYNTVAPDSKKIENKLTRIEENATITQLGSGTLVPVQSSQNLVKGMKSLHSNSSNKLITSPEKRNFKSNGSPCVPGVPQMGLRVGSPHRGDSSPKTGSVLHKAALFESSPTKKNVKDPTELSVSERLALFERNKGQALVPKAAFSMPVPAKYLADSNAGEKNMSSKISSPGRGNRMVGRVVMQLQGSFASGNEAKEVLPPGKRLMQADKSSVAEMAPSPPTSSEGLSVKSSKALAQMFEYGNTITSDNVIIKSVQSERQKEMDMLLNRWNKNKQLASSGDSNVNADSESNRTVEMKQESSGPPHPPRLPTSTDLLMAQSNKGVAGFSSLKTDQDPRMSPSTQAPQKDSNVPKPPPLPKIYEAQDIHLQYTGLTDVKRIKVSPPKPGRLYPCLSDIEATETESEMADDQSISGMNSSGEENLAEISFGRAILKAAGIDITSDSINKVHESQRDSSDDESAVLEEIAHFLEDLGSESDSDTSPSPVKKTKDNHLSPQRDCSSQTKKRLYCSPTTSQSHSFKYSKGPSVHKPEPDSTPRKAEHIPAFVVEGNEQAPLMHTVSFYRRQQNMAVKGTPVRQVVRRPEPELEPGKVLNNVEVKVIEGAVKKKLAMLVDEVSKQETVISQASQALNLCCSTIEFSGSAEQVEGERLLLVATHRRQAALHEIQRLRVEGSLKPQGSSTELTEQGSLVITNLTLPLKKNYLHTMAADERCHHFVCVVRAQEQVVASPVLTATSENLRRGGGAALVFPGSLRLDGLYSDFKVTLEIYNLQTNREVLPHDIKYHIFGKKDGSGNKLRLTPKKLLKQESRMVMPTVHSPAGPSAVRSPAFQMSGYVVFSLRELRRTQFTLNKVAFASPLEGNIQLQLSSELQLDVGERGFLTMFEDLSGFGAWHRRWCQLNGATLSYWKYPDDEEKKVPIGQIDLNICTTEVVGPVPRDICARPHTFLLETTRPSQPDDEDSLVLVRCGTDTVIRHLLSADTRRDFAVWCVQLNKALTMLRTWGSKSSNF